MSLIDEEGRRIVEPGIFEVYIGGSQPDERSQTLTGTKVIKGTFEITGNTLELEY
jgi:beta-glucosidase